MRTKLLLITLLLPIAMAAQIAAICPECGVYFSPEEAKWFDNPHFHRPGCTWVKKKLKDVKPMAEVSSNFSDADRLRLYGYGNGLQCPHCLGTTRHDSDCPIGFSQIRAQELLHEAQQTTTEDARKRAVWQYQNMENNINILAQAAIASAPSQQPVNSAPSQTQPAPSTGSYQHLSSVDIKNEYDKMLSFGCFNAAAYGKTAPNGTERWVLYDTDGEEVGQFSKIEAVDAGNGEDEYFLVRDDNGQWGIYGRGGGLMCEPRYESVKLLTALQGGEKRPFFDVARRLPNGQVLHGLVDPFIASQGAGEITQCVFEQIELIDRSPAPHGVLAKVKCDGMWGVIDTEGWGVVDTEDYGAIIIPPIYSYINTFFTLKGGMYFIVGDGNGLGAYHVETMQEVVPVTAGYSLDKVKSIINSREQ